MRIAVPVHRRGPTRNAVAYLWLRYVGDSPSIRAWAGDIRTTGAFIGFKDESTGTDKQAVVDWDGHKWVTTTGEDPVDAVVRFIDEVLAWAENRPPHIP